ncbi:hypothetical protein GH714_039612 [Hevea brasiliensis]|uniref:Rab3-GAP regulatory subunit N-terminal domain-containing protein n=1 Tax=Hevea brasiliensis TaxID=3981 RepID=A0A6A6KGM2_HEVBR|nr:hypothetical protein GH714_039612 [Hevea brasiliensis]
MSCKRSHTTEIACVACEELGDLGAGKEGWLVENPNLLCALDTHSLALANRSLILVTGWDDGPRLEIRPDLSPIESESITALEWLVFDEIRVIAVGTSWMVYPGRILKIRVRGTKKDLTRHTSSSEEISIVTGVIARFDGSDI